ncbi:MAG: response regulator [bacterium]
MTIPAHCSCCEHCLKRTAGLSAARRPPGVETIVQVAEKRPDIVLLDIGMPMGSGLTILPVLREIDPTICVIMLTVDNRSESVHTAISLGAKGYVVKQHLEPDRLLAAARRAATHLLFPETAQETFIEQAAQTSDAAEEESSDSEAQIATDEDGGAPKTVEEEPAPVPPEPAPDRVGNQVIGVLVDELPGVERVYVTGGLHTSESGSVFLYHPLTATREEGEVKHTFREILKHPHFLMSLFNKIEGFKEIPSILYDQGLDGGIYELLLKPMPAKGRLESVAFAARNHKVGEHREFPLGLDGDGGPYTVQRPDPSKPFVSLPNEHLLDEDMGSPELKNYMCSFNGLSLETCLFLSAFNIREITDDVNAGRVTKEKISSHIREVRSYAKWQGIPKAVLFGRFRLVPVPSEPASNLIVTASLAETESSGEDRADLYYWVDTRGYSPHLQHYLNRWSQCILPLLYVEEVGFVSLLFARRQKHRFGIKKSTDLAGLFDERGYTTVSVKDLTREFPTVRLFDLMRPLLLNTLLARSPSMRVESSLKSPLDIGVRKQHARDLMNGEGLQWIEKTKPFLYKEAHKVLEELEVSESNPNYRKELIRQITERHNISASLPTIKKPLEPVSEDQIADRVWASDKHLRKQRFKDKYGEP